MGLILKRVFQLYNSPCRHFLIHEFGNLDMPLAVAQLGHVQEHPQELQWTFSSPVELQWNFNRAPVQMELKFSSGTPVNPLNMLSQASPQSKVLLVHVHTYLAALAPQPGVACLYVLGQTWPQGQVLPIHFHTEFAAPVP